MRNEFEMSSCVHYNHFIFYVPVRIKWNAKVIARVFPCKAGPWKGPYSRKPDTELYDLDDDCESVK